MIQPHDDHRLDSCLKSLSAGTVKRVVKRVWRKPVVACLTALVVAGSLVLAQQLLKNAKTEQAEPSLHATLQGLTKINGVVFSPDGKTLATIRRGEDGSQTDTVELWEAATGQKRAVLSWKPVLQGGGLDGTVHFSPDSTTLATAGYGWGHAITLRLWNVKTGQERATLKGPSRIRSVVFNSDGKTAALEGLADAITLWDAATGKKRAALKTTEVLRVANGLQPVVILSPDGKTILTAGKDGTIKLWEAATGRERATLQRSIEDLRKAVLSPDGKKLVTMAGEDRTVKLWDVATGRERATLITLNKPGLRGEHELIFSPDGKFLATHENYDLRLWDVATANQRRIIRRVAYLQFSPDSKRLTTGIAFTSKLWDLVTGKQLAVFPEVNRVIFTPDSKILATVDKEVADGKSPDGIVKLWDATTGQLLDTLRIKGQAKEYIAVEFSPDGKTMLTRGWALATASGVVRLWDVATRKERAMLKGLTNQLSEWKFSSDSKTLAMRVGDTVQLWDVATGKKRATLEKTDTLQPIGVMLFSPDGKTLATGGNNDSIKLWDAACGRLRATLKGARGNVVFNPNSKTVVTSAMGYHPRSDFKLWDLATGRELATLPSIQSQSVVFTPDSNTLVTVGMEAAVKLWDVATGKEHAALEGPPAGIRAMRFSPDGKTLATMMQSDEPRDRPRGQPGIDTVKLWDAATGKERTTLNGGGEAVFSPDSKMMVTTKRNGIKLWDAATGRERLALWNKWFLTFSPDSKILVTMSDGKVSEGKVQLWDAATGMERLALEGVGEAFLDPDGKVEGMLAVFSPDGKILATQSNEAVKLWNLATGKKRTTLKGDGKVVFSPDGKILATDTRGGIKLWDAATGKERATLRGQWFMSFSPDSSLLATSDDVKDIRLWSLSPKK